MSIFGIAKKGFGLLGKALEKVENVKMSDKTAGNLGMGVTAGAVIAAGPLAELKHKRKKKKKMSPGERKARTGSSTKKLKNKKGK